MSLIRDFFERFGKGKKETPPPQEVMNYSTTLTPATEGVETKADFDPDVATILEYLKSDSPTISISMINVVSSYYFKLPPFEPGGYVFNTGMTNGMCFVVKDVKPVFDANGDLDDLILTFNDITFGEGFVVQISIKSLNEFFVKFKVPTYNETRNTQK